MATVDSRGAGSEGQADVPAGGRTAARRVPLRDGAALAERLGYDPALLDRVPAAAVESFAGVGYIFGLAQLVEGERVVDLGSGSGMDACYAAQLVGSRGRVVGIDFTRSRCGGPRRLAAAAGLDQVEFRERQDREHPGRRRELDCVISNGVINLSPDKARVFAEAARILRPGGRLAIADIVSERQLADSIVGDADLWAACIGGAAQQDASSRRSRTPAYRHRDVAQQLPVHLPAGPRRQRQIRREKHLAARNQVQPLSSELSHAVQEALSWQRPLIARRPPPNRPHCAPVRH